VTTVLASNVPLNTSGQASVSTSALAAGTHFITASYSGDVHFSSGSMTLIQRIHSSASNTVITSSPNPPVAGQAVTFTATVSAVPPGSGTPTGEVTFEQNGVVTAQAPLNSSGTVSYSVTSFVANTTISANYPSDPLFASSSGTWAPDFSVSTSPGSQSIVAGNTATYSVTVAPINGFSGSVSLSASGLPAGASPTFNANPVSIVGASVTPSLTISTNTAVPAGTYNFNVTGQSGTLTHQSGASLTVSAAPNSITVNPASGSGLSQMFVFTYTVPNQAQEHILFNTSLNGTGACWFFYDQRSNTLSLANDQGNAFTQSATPGTSATLSNSQCSLPMSSTSVSNSGNTTTLTLTINFSASFTGTKNIYVNTVNTSGVAGPALQSGTGSVSPITVNPSVGSGLSQMFVFTYMVPNQAQEHILFNTSLNGTGACWFFYDQRSNTLSLANDQGNAFNQSAAPGTSATLSNNQCSLPMSSTSVSNSGNTTTLTLTINFSGAFTGTKNIYVNTVNTSGVAGTAQQIGTWTP
jgi:hypothetical protein